MKHKYLICLLCLCSMIFTQQSNFAAEAMATFTFGKIEILKTDKQEWAFLEKETPLATEDLIRMPPVSLIRLRDADGTFSQTLAGGREVSVEDLIREGRQVNRTKAKRINVGFEERSATDVLPVHEQPQLTESKTVTGTSLVVRITDDELETLRQQLNALPDELIQQIPQLSTYRRQNAERTPVTDGYPSPNLDIARIFYDALRRLEATLDDSVNLTLLYAQMLNYVGIDADLAFEKNGRLVAVFDCQVPFEREKSISANRKLVNRREQSDTIWISIQVQPHEWNFTTAWYEGSELE